MLVATYCYRRRRPNRAYYPTAEYELETRQDSNSSTVQQLMLPFAVLTLWQILAAALQVQQKMLDVIVCLFKKILVNLFSKVHIFHQQLQQQVIMAQVASHLFDQQLQWLLMMMRASSQLLNQLLQQPQLQWCKHCHAICISNCND